MNQFTVERRLRADAELARKQRGFTLVELMVVVAILSIILMIAIPAYLDYAIRTQVSEGMSIFPTVKQNVVETYFTNGGVWPTSNEEAGMLMAGSYQTDYVESISIGTRAGSVVIDFDIPDLGGRDTIIYVPIAADGGIEWRCNRGSVLPRFRPPVCR